MKITDVTPTWTAETRESVGEAVEKIGAAFAAQGDRDKRLTVQAVVVTHEALRLGYCRDAGVKDPEDGSISQAAYARACAVTQATVGFWITLAAGMDKGIGPDHDLWSALATTGKAARNPEIKAAMRDPRGTAETVRREMVAQGRDLTTGRKLPGARVAGPNGDSPDGTDLAGPALKALDAFAKALKVLPRGASDEYDAIRAEVGRILRDENKRRGVAAPTPRPRAPRKAVPDATDEAA